MFLKTLPTPQPRLIRFGNNQEAIIPTSHKLYKLRYAILARCYKASKKDYLYYQAKGIKVCDEWKNDPDTFLKWALENGWREGFCLDRKDPKGDYTPNNCQFISMKENLSKMHKDIGTNSENSVNAKLKEAQVKEIKKLLDLGITCSKIANDFCVAKSTISAIKRRINWKHI